MIYLAADHRGFRLKESLKALLLAEGHAVEDVGALALDSGDDYPDFAAAAAKKIAAGPAKHKGILLCGSGHGVDIVANKFKGVRAALCWNADVARQSRAHDDANVLVFAADWLDENNAKEIVRVWLATPFSGEERHRRRLEKINQVESANFY